MKASEYLARKKDRKFAKRSVRVFGSPCQCDVCRQARQFGANVDAHTATTLALSGTTADIDTEEKRHAIASAALTFAAQLAGEADHVELCDCFACDPYGNADHDVELCDCFACDNERRCLDSHREPK